MKKIPKYSYTKREIKRTINQLAQILLKEHKPKKSKRSKRSQRCVTQRKACKNILLKLFII